MDFTGVNTNLPTECLDHYRQEMQRITLMRNNVRREGLYPSLAQLLDILYDLNATMIRLGESPLSHAGLVEMLQTSFSIRYVWNSLNVPYD